MTPDVAAIEARLAAATPGPWAWGRLITDQAGDYVVWRHRGEVDEVERPDVGHIRKGPEPQRMYVGNVGKMMQPVIEADLNDVLANQVFEGEATDAALIAHAPTDLRALLDERAELLAQIADLEARLYGVERPR